MTTARPGRKPFYVHIATLFILLFTLLGSALIALQFQQGARQGLEHERQNFLQYRQQLALALQLNERPARMSLSLLRSGQLAAAQQAEGHAGRPLVQLQGEGQLLAILQEVLSLVFQSLARPLLELQGDEGAAEQGEQQDEEGGDMHIEGFTTWPGSCHGHILVTRAIAETISLQCANRMTENTITHSWISGCG